jgi:hypothetical protein
MTECEFENCHELATTTTDQLGMLRHVCDAHAPDTDDSATEGESVEGEELDNKESQ